jgi:hypothetical protein
VHILRKLTRAGACADNIYPLYSYSHPMTWPRVAPGPCAGLVCLACIKIMEMALFRPPMRARICLLPPARSYLQAKGRGDACHEFRCRRICLPDLLYVRPSFLCLISPPLILYMIWLTAFLIPNTITTSAITSVFPPSLFREDAGISDRRQPTLEAPLQPHIPTMR